METTINGKILGKKLTFFIPGESGYVFVDLNGREGSLGNQICQGGRLLGSTLRASNQDDLNRTAQRWYRAYLANERKSGRIE
jgi:hypothetical protein